MHPLIRAFGIPILLLGAVIGLGFAARSATLISIGGTTFLALITFGVAISSLLAGFNAAFRTIFMLRALAVFGVFVGTTTIYFFAADHVFDSAGQHANVLFSSIIGVLSSCMLASGSFAVSGILETRKWQS